MEDLLIPLGGFALIGAIIWLRGRVTQLRLSKQAETQKRLLEKFDSARELTEFIDTESGQRFMKQLETNPHSTILGTLGTGVVSVFLGIGFLSLMGRESDMLFPGVAMLAFGLGLIVAAGIVRRFSRKWSAEAVR